MESKIETKALLGYAKKIVDKQTFKRIKGIKDKKEKLEALKYSIKSELEMMHYGLSRKIKKMQGERKDVFVEEVKISLLNSKIRYFLISYHKSDFKNLLNLYNEIKKEMTDV